MKAILVIDIPDAYADRYNVENMYVWNLNVQDKHGYEILVLATDKPSHLRPLPQKKNAIIHQGEINKEIPIEFLEKVANQGYNTCLDEILNQHVESVENALEIADEEADCCGVQFWHDD